MSFITTFKRVYNTPIDFIKGIVAAAFVIVMLLIRKISDFLSRIRVGLVEGIQMHSFLVQCHKFGILEFINNLKGIFINPNSYLL